jgi:predicted DNA-binding transcriptional regulator AlpA
VVAEGGGVFRDRLLTVSEVAAILNVAPRWVYRRAGSLPFARKLSANTLRFSEAGLYRWIERRKP